MNGQFQREAVILLDRPRVFARYLLFIGQSKTCSRHPDHLDRVRSSSIDVYRSRLGTIPSAGVTIDRFIHQGGASFLSARTPGLAQETLKPARETHGACLGL